MSVDLSCPVFFFFPFFLLGGVCVINYQTFGGWVTVFDIHERIQNMQFQGRNQVRCLL